MLCPFLFGYNFTFGACHRFTLKQKSGSDEDSIEITVYDYFVKHRHIELRYSADLPCINVGKPKRPTYIPVEVELLFPLKLEKLIMLVIAFLPLECFFFLIQLCSLVSLQRYTKALSTFQRASLVEKSRQKPQERMRVLSDVGLVFLALHLNFIFIDS